MRTRTLAALALVLASLSVEASLPIRLFAAQQSSGSPPVKKATSARLELGRLNIQYTPEAFITHAAQGDLRTVELFLNSGFSPDVRNQDGFTALIWAAGQGRISVVKALLARGADVNATSMDRTTALMAGASQGHSLIVRLLVAKGATIDARRADGQTALIRAAIQNQADSVRILLASRADIEAADSRGMTSLIYAAANLGVEDPDGLTLPVVETLLSRGARPDHRADDGSTALAWAARKGEQAIVDALIATNADVNATDRDGRTPLMHSALGGGAPSIAAALIARGANINARDKQGVTPLSLTARRRTSGMLRLLLASGADPNARDNDGATALFEATKFGRLDNVRALLGGGADCGLKDSRGRTAADLAMANHQNAILAILKEGSP
jgi:ankyrin repeat protein